MRDDAVSRSLRLFSRCVLGVVSILLTEVWWAVPTSADEGFNDCLEVRSQSDDPVVVNICQFAVDALVCCASGDGSGSCEGKGFSTLTIGSNESAIVPSCDGSGASESCRDPHVLGSVAHDASRGGFAWQCLDMTSFLSSRETEPRPLPDVIANNDERTEEGGFALAGAQLPGEDLRGIDFSGADLTNANLDGTNLFRVDMYGANCRGATFRDAYLQYTKLVGADLTDADLTGADMQGTRTREATFCNTTMSDGTINNDDCPP